MTIVELSTNKGMQFCIECRCGWTSPERNTLEAAGRDADLHMAQKFPTPTIRRPCYSPTDEMVHLLGEEIDGKSAAVCGQIVMQGHRATSELADVRCRACLLAEITDGRKLLERIIDDLAEGRRALPSTGDDLAGARAAGKFWGVAGFAREERQVMPTERTPNTKITDKGRRPDHKTRPAPIKLLGKTIVTL